MSSFPMDSYEPVEPHYLPFPKSAESLPDPDDSPEASLAENSTEEQHPAIVPFRRSDADVELAFYSAGPRLRRLQAEILRAAESASPLLITGEAGTETDASALLIHRCSPNAANEFLSFDCAVLTAELFDELVMPKLRQASESSTDSYRNERTQAPATIVLQNADCISQRQQREIAQLVRSGAKRTPGSAGQSTAVIRLIATSHLSDRDNAQQSCFEPSFHGLFGRHTLQLPPLRATRSDIPEIVQQVLHELAQVEGLPRKCLTASLLETFAAYDWPGNLQELRNVLARACSLSRDDELNADDVAPWLASQEIVNADDPALTVRQMERKLIETTFARCAGNREKTANILQIGLRTLSGKLREYGYPPRGGPGSNQVQPAAKAA